jgi:uncharacterized membrane protein
LLGRLHDPQVQNDARAATDSITIVALCRLQSSGCERRREWFAGGKRRAARYGLKISRNQCRSGQRIIGGYDVTNSKQLSRPHHWRFHLPHAHLSSVFGDDWFALKAEGFARFFGTPTFLIAQTVIVLVWMGINLLGWTQFDVYPFILLNLAFSLQAAYAAPLILLAQTRQADRDKAHSEADAMHREELHQISDERQQEMHRQSCLLVEMMGQNNKLTEQVSALIEQNLALTHNVRELTERIESLTVDVRDRLSTARS